MVQNGAFSALCAACTKRPFCGQNWGIYPNAVVTPRRASIRGEIFSRSGTHDSRHSKKSNCQRPIIARLTDAKASRLHGRKRSVASSIRDPKSCGGIIRRRCQKSTRPRRRKVLSFRHFQLTPVSCKYAPFFGLTQRHGVHRDFSPAISSASSEPLCGISFRYRGIIGCLFGKIASGPIRSYYGSYYGDTHRSYYGDTHPIP
jgi:hypothetical protein